MINNEFSLFLWPDSNCPFHVLCFFSEKLVSNYSTLETYYAKTPEKYKQNFPEKEHVPKITYNTSVFEMEEIVTKGNKKKWLTVGEAIEDFQRSK